MGLVFRISTKCHTAGHVSNFLVICTRFPVFPDYFALPTASSVRWSIPHLTEQHLFLPPFTFILDFTLHSGCYMVQDHRLTVVVTVTWVQRGDTFPISWPSLKWSQHLGNASSSNNICQAPSRSVWLYLPCCLSRAFLSSFMGFIYSSPAFCILQLLQGFESITPCTTYPFCWQFSFRTRLPSSLVVLLEDFTSSWEYFLPFLVPHPIPGRQKHSNYTGLLIILGLQFFQKPYWSF